MAGRTTEELGAEGPGREQSLKARPARFDSRALLQAAREIIIEHDGTDYRLRLTSNGKLILTK